MVAMFVLLGPYFAWWFFRIWRTARIVVVAAPDLLVIVAAKLGWLVKLPGGTRVFLSLINVGGPWYQFEDGS
ncbi:hypothetical protein R4P64_18215 [Rhodococcus sp. IEGM 1366]|uniref:hypothetical protein n=1 Tax=Rhodococcus sp. IEGM 1366 TaxID=3082223 RepID=UPI002954F1EB|nr:hypothetical protein [Rhodococcus sp. IEGM 1366]MDV8068454.1 hypothetical protein [Rhodococcus sp. IEGM 1366]